MSGGSYVAVDSTEADRLRAQAGLLWQRELALLRDHGLRPQGPLLDVGCGPGFILRQLHAAGVGPLLGIDRESRHLAVAKGAAPLMRATAEALPLRDASVEQVLLRLVLRHVRSVGEVLREARRVLKPGARVLIVDGDDGGFLFHAAPPSWPRLHQALMDTVADLGADPRVGRSLWTQLGAAGFSDVKVTPWVIQTPDVPAPALVELLLAPGVRPVAPQRMAQSDVAQAWTDLRTWATQPSAYGAVVAFVASGKA